MFSQPIKQYADNLEGLRDFIGLIGPFLQRKRSQTVKQKLEDLIPAFIGAAKLEIKDPSELQELAELEASFKELTNCNFSIRTESNDSSKDNSVTIVFPDSEEGQKRAEATRHAMALVTRRAYQQRLLYENALMSLVSTTEWFLSQILHEYFRKFPDALSNKDKVFSLENLRDLGSIDDAVSYIIDAKIEDILRGSLDDWIVFLGRN